MNESTKRKTIFNISIVEDYMIINMQVILPVEDGDELDLIILVLMILIEIMIMIIVLINLI
ncbi:MAG TPA: hypothetical protein PK891_01470 [Bacteroidales bacterium]|nr:hypothetical protein [Bacteroidales bacterium]